MSSTCRLDWDRWLMMGLIGVVTGLVGILLHQTIYVIGQVKWHKAESYFQVSVYQQLNTQVT